MKEATLIVVFMCQAGGAKSVIAASYFNRAAQEQGLPFVATAVAAETPYDAVPEPVTQFLANEDIDVASFKPRHVTDDDLSSATKVVSIGCDVANTNIERWDDVPKVTDDLPGSAASIRKHVDALIAELGRVGR